MKSLLSLLIIFISVIHLLTAQDLIHQLESYRNAYHLEKVYVNHDKPYYLPGETIWGKVFLVDGVTHLNFDAEPLIYVDWISPHGNILNTYHIKIKNGTAALSIDTNPKDSVGTYTLRAYSLYQRNFDPKYIFQKEIQIIDFSNLEGDTDTIGKPRDFEVQFFPEGGYLIQELESHVAFKALNDLGENVTIRGMIVDDEGQKIADLKTWHEGMGRFRLRPEAGQSYTAIVHGYGQEKRFELPEPLPNGYQLEINTLREQEIVIKVNSNLPEGLQNTQLIGHVRGQLFFHHVFDEQEDQTLLLKKEKLYNGLLHFTLFDAKSRPTCERLVFNTNPRETTIVNIDLEAQTIKQRSPIKGSISTLQNGIPTPVQASMSIFLKDPFVEQNNELNIQNYLWLQSDLKGKVSNIGSYFVENNRRSRTLLDLLLMTHGWRRFNWQDIQNNDLPTLIYPAEEHFSIVGKATKTNSDQAVKADITFFILDVDNFSGISYTTNQDGVFSFSGFDFMDTTEIMIQSNIHNPRKAKKQKEDVIQRKGNTYLDLELLHMEAFPFSDSSSLTLSSQSEITTAHDDQSHQLLQQSYTKEKDLWSIDLEEVIVKSTISPGTEREFKIKKRYKELGFFYRSSTQKFVVEDWQLDQFKFQNIFQMIQNIVPRASVIMENGQPIVVWGNVSERNKMLISIDGRVVPPSFLTTIDPRDIAFIDRTDTPQFDDWAARQRYNATGPLILLVSKDPSKIKKPTPGVLHFAHPGYYQARTFYSPSYPNTKEKASDPDFRTTLLWNPMIETRGETIDFSCYSGDLPGEYVVWVEGISEKGVPFVGSKVFKVE